MKPGMALRRLTLSRDDTEKARLRHKNVQAHMPLCVLCRLQRHHAGVHSVPFLSERVGEVVLVLDGYKFLAGGA